MRLLKQSINFGIPYRIRKFELLYRPSGTVCCGMDANGSPTNTHLGRRSRLKIAKAFHSHLTNCCPPADRLSFPTPALAAKLRWLQTEHNSPFEHTTAVVRIPCPAAVRRIVMVSSRGRRDFLIKEPTGTSEQLSVRFFRYVTRHPSSPGCTAHRRF